MEKLTKFEELMLFILDRANKMGIKNLSDFQFMKTLYMLEIFSLKYVGIKFIDEIFTRHENGPITTSFYPARNNLLVQGYMKKEEIENPKYGHNRTGNMLSAKRLNKFRFNTGETIFLDNFLSDLLPLSQKDLKDIAYKTEPMKAILKEEKGREKKKGVIIDFNKVVIDPDVMETYSDEL